MTLPNRNQLASSNTTQPLNRSRLAPPDSDVVPHVLQRMLLERLSKSSGIVFPRQPSLAPSAERLVETVSRLGGVASFVVVLIALLFIVL